jgi:hypothetical protein
MVLPGPGQWQVRVQDAANVAPVTITTGITYNGIDLTSSLASGITSAGLSSVLKNGAGLVQATSLQVGTGTPLPGAVINATQSNVGGTTQINAQNTSSDNAASSDLVATADNGSNTTNYTDCGINSSTYNQSSYSSGAADDGYCITTGNFFLGAISSGKVVTVGVGGAASTNVVATFSATGLSLPGSESAATYLTATNCTSSAAPAVCASAAAGSVLVAAAGTTVTVNTTAVTANSQIFVQEDSSLGTKLSVTCNVTPATAPPTISARVAATSFTITTTAPTTNPRCFSYSVLN